ncbi:alpha/beta hydrolase [Achromobacter spanius]|nr:alpha/beta hydrolase [Achromobacter spanius]
MIAATALVLASGCATPPTPAKRAHHADALAAAHGWSALTLEAAGFSLRAYVPPPPAAQTGWLTVYIEGDGLAWLTPSQVSPDPTPIDPVGLRLALAQPEGQAAYLARPCQFTGAHRSPCSPALWTTRRFAPEAVAATNQALDALQRRLGPRGLVLVGYSGGAAIAALAAARRHDVVALLSVAGNLDPNAWVRLHGLSPLTGSLDPATETDRLIRLAQYHFAGASDTVIPPALAHGYAARYPATRRPTVESVPGMTHAYCWAEQWPTLWRRAMAGLKP